MVTASCSFAPLGIYQPCNGDICRGGCPHTSPYTGPYPDACPYPYPYPGAFLHPACDCIWQLKPCDKRKGG